jgi:hypothetical protein
LEEEFPAPDQFDYDKLADTLLTPSECRFLASAADFFPAAFPPIRRLFVDEVVTRIAQMHEAERPLFERIVCMSKGDF